MRWIEELAAIVGAAHCLGGDEIGEHYRVDITRRYRSQPACLVRPAGTEEVAEVLKVARRFRVPVTVVGGQTGTCGAAVPADGGIALSLERMNRVLEVDEGAMAVTAEGGCVLQRVCEAAEERGLFLPLDLGARGSATLGGVLATNAGGNRVVRFGMARERVLGLEAVLADGTVVSALNKMLKDNAGYAWKHLLIGSEGTLGVITRAVLRLEPLPETWQTALLAIDDFDRGLAVFRRLSSRLGGRLCSFELMWQSFYERMVCGRATAPLPTRFPFYALVESFGGDPQSDAQQFERTLVDLLEKGWVADAVIAQSAREREQLWAIREDLAEGLAPLRPFRSYDVGMALPEMPRFARLAEERIRAQHPQAVVLFYGHAGDGNLHAIVSVGRMDEELAAELDLAVYQAVAEVGGTISAEHGIGVARAPYLSLTRTPAELALMVALKRTLDPDSILNPGKVLPA